MKDRAVFQLRRRKIRDRSIVLLLVGIALFMPPIAGISLVDRKIAGLPVPVVYLFTIWIMLIAGAGAIARGLRDSDVPLEPGEPGETED